MPNIREKGGRSDPGVAQVRLTGGSGGKRHTKRAVCALPQAVRLLF